MNARFPRSPREATPGTAVAPLSAMKLRVWIEKSRGTGAFLASCPEIPGGSATAPSREEALARLRHRLRELLCPRREPAPVGIEAAELEL